MDSFHNRPSFYKYVTAQVAKIILSNKRLRWSAPALFDDHYDVTRELASGIKPAEVQQCAIDALLTLVKSGEEAPQGLNHSASILFKFFLIAQKRNKLDELIRRLSERDAASVTHFQAFKEMQEIWQQWLPTFRVLCLSARNDITLMWEKYADNYTGVVLEFACSKEFDAPWIIAKPVLYDDRPSLLNKAGWGKLVTLNQDNGVKFIFNESCHTKTSAWAYQEEWRVVSFRRPTEETEYSDYIFCPQTLSAVYLGPGISPADKEDVLTLLKDELSHVTVYGGYITNKHAIEFKPI